MIEKVINGDPEEENPLLATNPTNQNVTDAVIVVDNEKNKQNKQLSTQQQQQQQQSSSSSSSSSSASSQPTIRAPRLIIPWSKILCNGPVWALAVGKFGYYYSFFMVVTWLPTYLGEMGMDKYTAAYMSAVPFGMTCPAIIFFGWLAYYLVNHLNVSLNIVRKTFGAISFLANILCFTALLFVKQGSPYTALLCFVLM